MRVFADGLVIAGAIILVAALVPIARVAALLPPGGVRRQWYLLTVFVVLFFAADVGYAMTSWESPNLMVSIVFFSGACFVWQVGILSFKTALDVRRVALLEQETITDPLMQIYNRRYLERRLKEEVARSQRYERPLSLLLLDVDHFKRINDTYGHAMGDRVLQNLGQLLRHTVREADILVRYGGEEILVVAPDTPSAVAATLAERLRQAVENTPLAFESDHPGARTVPITVSIGVASVQTSLESPATLMRRADEALYRAKHAGRNRVVTGELAPSS